MGGFDYLIDQMVQVIGGWREFEHFHSTDMSQAVVEDAILEYAVCGSKFFPHGLSHLPFRSPIAGVIACFFLYRRTAGLVVCAVQQDCRVSGSTPIVLAMCPAGGDVVP